MKKWVAFWSLPFIYGSVLLFISYAVEQLHPFEVIFARSFIAAIGLHGYLLMTGKRLPRDPMILGSMVLLGALNIAIPITMVAWAQQTITTGLSSLLNAVAPLIVLVMAHFTFADERMTWRKVVGLIIGFGGVLVLAIPNSTAALVANPAAPAWVAELVVLGSAFFFALSSILTRKVLQRGVQTQVLAAGVVSSGALMTGFVTYLILPPTQGLYPLPLAQWEMETLFAVVMLGVICTMFNFLLTYYVIHEMGTIRAAMLGYLAPPVSVALGVIFRGELLSPHLVIGGTVILIGVIIANLPRTSTPFKTLVAFKARFKGRYTPAGDVSAA